MIAHQRTRRDELEVEETGDLWGSWWRDLDVSLDRAVVKEISRSAASPIVERYEWMRSMPAVSWHCYAALFDGHIGGVVVYGPEYAENLGVWDRYGYTGRIILLARGVTLHWAHEHTASWLIRRSMALLPARYEVVTATVDPLAGEVGTVYQASGFDYVGTMEAHGGGIRSAGWHIDGKTYTERSMRARMGGRFTADRVMSYWPSAELRVQELKGRYFAFRGSKRQRIADRAAIAHFIKPYPKRAVGVGQTSLASSEEVLGEFQPTAPPSL